MVHPPFFACLAFVNGGALLMSCQSLAGRSGGTVPPIAKCTRASPSVRACFASLSCYSPRQKTTSLPRTGTAWRRAAERVTKVGWWVHTGGPACAGGSGGVEDIIPKVLHGRPQMGLQPSPPKKGAGHMWGPPATQASPKFS